VPQPLGSPWAFFSRVTCFTSPIFDWKKALTSPQVDWNGRLETRTLQNNFFYQSIYSRHPKAGLSCFRMAISRTLFGSGYRMVKLAILFW
jgi:hypothetical protein